MDEKRYYKQQNGVKMTESILSLYHDGNIHLKISNGITFEKWLEIETCFVCVVYSVNVPVSVLIL